MASKFTNNAGKALGAKTTADQVLADAPSVVDKTFLVTGGYSGIGAETALSLLRAGARVIIAGRRQTAIDDFLKKHEHERLSGVLIDLGDLSSVAAGAKTFREQFKTLDVLINNAGIMNCPQSQTTQGFESQMGINVIGTFLLTKLLLPTLQESGNGRAIFLSSLGHAIHGAKRIDVDYYRNYTADSPYDGWVQYQQSKLGDILLAREFDRRDGLETAAVHPGVINTNLARDTSIFSSLCFVFKNLTRVEGFKSIPCGASTTVLAATTDQLQSGAYLADCQYKDTNVNATIKEDWAALYDYCDEVTKDFQS